MLVEFVSNRFVGIEENGIFRDDIQELQPIHFTDNLVINASFAVSVDEFQNFGFFENPTLTYLVPLFVDDLNGFFAEWRD